MAGHSKWANIQHRKGAQDKRRGKVFSKLIREISTAARGGSDLAANSGLRLAVDRAKAQNMPNDTIERAIKRGAGEVDGVSYERVTYEGYGPGGVAVMVESLTDNRNRTVAEVRHAFSRFGGNLGADGSVAYLFNHVGLLSFEAGIDEDRLMAAAIEAGAEDVVANDDTSLDVLTAPSDFEKVREILRDASLEPAVAEVTMRASVTTPLAADDAATMIRLLECLEDLDDVQQVYSNADIATDVLEAL